MTNEQLPIPKCNKTELQREFALLILKATLNRQRPQCGEQQSTKAGTDFP